MRILIDANILLDVTLARPGLHETSGEALRQCSGTSHAPFIAWHTLSNVYYVLSRQGGHDPAIEFLDDLLKWVCVASVGHMEAEKAIGYGMADLEDALQLSAAEACSADVILTRNVKDFDMSAIRAYSPEDFLHSLI